MATQGGPAKAVVVQTGGQSIGGPAIPVAVVTDGRAVEGGSSMPVVVVTSGPVQGGPALPVVAASGAQASQVMGGKAIPVYVVSGSFAAPVDPTMAYTNKVIATSPIAYWPMAESSGTVALDVSGNARNGAYSNVTLGQPGIGDGRTSASFNGTTSFNNIYSASLAGAFNGDEGTVAFWFQVSGAGVWGDGTRRYAVGISVDGNNQLILYKDPNQFVGRRIASGTSKLVSFATTSIAWLHFAMTWSKAADQQKFYANGAQTGSTQTGLAAWAGAIGSNVSVVGALNVTPTNVTSGFIAHAALWNTPLSPATIATLASVT